MPAAASDWSRGVLLKSFTTKTQRAQRDKANVCLCSLWSLCLCGEFSFVLAAELPRHLVGNALAERAVQQRAVVAAGEQLHHRVALEALQRLLEQPGRALQVEVVLGAHVDVDLARQLWAE